MSLEIRTYCFTIILIILVYAGFAFRANALSADDPQQGNYQYLTEGFLSGHLNLSISPPAQLLQLKNPYDAMRNKNFRQLDASLYHGKYYLYFGPLPVFIYFMPFKCLTGVNPSNASAVFVFLSLSFIMGFSLLLKIKRDYFSHISPSQFVWAGLVIGFANNSLFLLGDPKCYQVAISCAFCLMSFALFFLYHVFYKNFRIADIFFCSLCLSLAIAARPHFVLADLFLNSVLLVYILKNTPKKQMLARVMALMIPFISVISLLFLYNYLRFDSILEFGQQYQLATINYYKVLFINKDAYHNIVKGLAYYLFYPLSIKAHFPYFNLATPLPSIHQFYTEPVAGILMMAPCIVFIIFLPRLILFYIKKSEKTFSPFLRFFMLTAAVPLIILLFLTTMPGVTQRYESDFLPYILMLSILTLWLEEKYHLHVMELSRQQNKMLDYCVHDASIKLTRKFFIFVAIMSIFINIAIDPSNTIGWVIFTISWMICKTMLDWDLIRQILLACLFVLICSCLYALFKLWGYQCKKLLGRVFSFQNLNIT